MRNALIILTLIFAAVGLKTPIAWLFVALFGMFSLYCLFTGKGKGRSAREKTAAALAWEEAVDSALKDCPFCHSKIIKSAIECPYCGVLLEDVPAEETDAPDKNGENTVTSD